jgi:crossover junction endodeoxyribonuclease RusA
MVPARRPSLPDPVEPPPGPGTPSPDPGANRQRDDAAPGPGMAPVPAGSALDADGALPDRPGRTYTLALPPGLKLLSLNDRIHFSERYRRSEALKKAAWAMAIHRKVPRLERVSIVVEYQPRDRRLRDPDNIAASAKAAIDGCRAAGVLPQDDSRHVTEVICRIGEPYPLGRLVLHLTEVAATGGDAT